MVKFGISLFALLHSIRHVFQFYRFRICSKGWKEESQKFTLDNAYGVGVAAANANRRVRPMSANRCVVFNPCIEPATLRERGLTVVARSRIMELGSRAPVLLIREICLRQLRPAP